MMTQNRGPLFLIRLAGLLGCVAAVLALEGCTRGPELPVELTKPLLTLGGFNQAVGAVAYSPDGSLLAAAEYCGKMVKVWEADTGKEVLTLDSGALGLAFSPDSKRLILGTLKDQVRDARTGKALVSLKSMKSFDLHGFGYSPDGRWIALGGSKVEFRRSIERPGHPEPDRIETGLIQVFDAETGALDSQIEVPGTRAVGSVAFSVDGSRVATVVWDDDKGEVLRIWDVQTGKVILDLKGPTKNLGGVVFSPDGSSIASVAGYCYSERRNPYTTAYDKDGVIRIHGPDGRVVEKWPPGKDGERDIGCRVQVWHATTGEARCLLPGYYDTPQGLAFSPDGRHVALGTNEFITVGEREASVKVWDVSTQKLVFRIVRSNDDVRGLAFSPDGKRIATASDGTAHRGEVKVWDVSAYLER